MQKFILITGTSRGIGKAIVENLLQQEQNTVLALSRAPCPVYLENHPNLKWFNYDAENWKTEAYFSELLYSWVNKIDVLINNAATLINKPFHEITMHESVQLMQTNFHFAAELIRQCIPLLSESKSPHVLNISSMAGFQGSVKFGGLSHYAASKAALQALTEVLAVEYPHIKFNALALGAVQTEMLSEAFPEAKTEMTAQQMAQYITDFALHAHNYFNGKILPVSKSTP